MISLARFLLALSIAVAGLAASNDAAATICYAPYNCVSSYNACKQPCNVIKHANNGVHH